MSAGAVEIELRELEAHLDVVALVEQRRPVHRRLAVVLVTRGVLNGFVDERVERAVARRAERDALPGERAIAQAEHLLAGQRNFDGPFQRPRGQDGQEHLILRPQP